MASAGATLADARASRVDASRKPCAPARQRAGAMSNLGVAVRGVKLVAFDLDGTMVDSCPDLHDAADKTCKAMNKPGVSIEQVAGYIGNGADVLIARCISGSLEEDPSLTPETKTEARVLFDKFYTEGEHRLSTLYPDVASTLSSLRDAGLILVVVTNKPAEFAPHVLEVAGIREYFEDVVGGDTFPKKKPDPVALKWLMEKHGVPSSALLLLCDALIASARPLITQCLIWFTQYSTVSSVVIHLAYQVKPEEMVMVGDSRNDILAGLPSLIPSLFFLSPLSPPPHLREGSRLPHCGHDLWLQLRSTNQ